MTGLTRNVAWVVVAILGLLVVLNGLGLADIVNVTDPDAVPNLDDPPKFAIIAGGRSYPSWFDRIHNPSRSGYCPA